jgi:hypothetical protein
MDYILSFIPSLSWWQWVGVGFAATLFAPRVVGGLIIVTVLGGLATVVVVCSYIFLSTLVPMVVGSWQANEASNMRARGYDKPEYRAEIAATVCPGYQSAWWFEKTFKAETRLLSWCEGWKGNE